MSNTPNKKNVDCRWADFQNPFIGDGVNPQNTWSSPPSDLGLFGQFSKLYANTNGSFSVMLAIGGWTWSQNFSLAVRTAASRTSLATSIVTLLQQWKCFKGVTIDWEYLSNDGVNYGNTGNVVDRSDSANFALFVQQLRSMFLQQGWNNYTISLCCTPAPEKIKFDVKSLVPLLDEWHIMTYEYHLNTFWTNRLVLLTDRGQQQQVINRISILPPTVRTLLPEQ